MGDDEKVAMVDFLCALAAVVAEAPSSNFVQPEFSDTLAVKSALHPMLFHFKKNRNQNTMTPNDIVSI